MNLKENILKYGSFVFVFLVPLVFWNYGLYPHISSKTFFIYGAVEILFSVWLYSLITDRSYRIPKKIFLWLLPLIGFILWMTIAAIFAVNPNLSFLSSLSRGTGLLTYYHSFAFLLIIISLVRRNGFQFITSLFQWFVSGGFVLAVSVWLGTEGFKLPMKVLTTDGGGGIAGNSTVAAGYFLFILMMAFFLLTLKSLNKTKKLLIGITVFLILFSPVFASLYSLFTDHGILGSARGTALALIVGVGFTWVGYMFLSKKKPVRLVSIVIIFIGVIVFSFMWAQLMNPSTGLHQKFAEEARGSRFIFWEISTKSMHEHPFLGYGPENYSIAFQDYFDPTILTKENSFEGWGDRAHNIYYDLGVSGGYPLIFLYILFLMSVFYALHKQYKAGRLSRSHTAIIAGLLVGYIAHNLFTFDSNLSILVLFVIVGIIYALNDLENKQKLLPVNINKTNKSLIASGLAVLLLVAITFFVFRPVYKSRLYAETFSSEINQRPPMYKNLLQGSHIGEQWDVDGLAYNIHKQYSTNPAVLKNDKQKLSYLIEDVNSLLSYLYKLSETNKTSYRLYLTIALLENDLTYLSDRPYSIENQERVLNTLEEAKALSPNNLNTYWVIAQTKTWGGDLKGAEKAYKDAIAINPSLPDPHKLLIIFAQIIRDPILYNDSIIQAEEDIPGFVETYGKELNIIESK